MIRKLGSGIAGRLLADPLFENGLVFVDMVRADTKTEKYLHAQVEGPSSQNVLCLLFLLLVMLLLLVVVVMMVVTVVVVI